MSKMTNSVVSQETVRKVAKLTNLTLTEEEVSKFAEMFTDTLKYMDMLNELDTNDVPETYQVTGLTNVFQTGDIKPSLDIDKALSNASDRVGDYFGTKGVFERS